MSIVVVPYITEEYQAEYINEVKSTLRPLGLKRKDKPKRSQVTYQWFFTAALILLPCIIWIAFAFMLDFQTADNLKKSFSYSFFLAILYAYSIGYMKHLRIKSIKDLSNDTNTDNNTSDRTV